MAVKRLLKQVDEILKIDAGSAATIEDIATAARGLVEGADPLGAIGAIIAGRAVLSLSGGEDGETYLVEALLGHADGSEIEAEYEVSVIDGAFTMPDGGPAMLSVAQFVARVGLDEVIRMTDMGDGRIDRNLVINALTDAQAIAEAHLSGRYALPFETVPLLVAVCISDMARARLYTNDPPANVDNASRVAMRNLERIGRGELTLGIEAPQSATTTDPVKIAPGTFTYPDRLQGYRG